MPRFYLLRQFIDDLVPFGIFRRHEAQKTQQIDRQTFSTLDAAEALLEAASDLDVQARQEIAAELRQYRDEYPDISWRNTGRLARLGLPRTIVRGLRYLRRARTIVSGSARATE